MAPIGRFDLPSTQQQRLLHVAIEMTPIITLVATIVTAIKSADHRASRGSLVCTAFFAASE